MISSPGANSESFPNQLDPNPIIDVGCPRSVGGIASAVTLCHALNIAFRLEPLDCTPFFHGYGRQCSEAQITIGIWNLPVTDTCGISASIPFYITRGDGFLLLGNEILHSSYLEGPRNILRIPPNVRGISKRELLLPTFFEQISTDDPDAGRTYLLVVPSKAASFQSFVSSHEPRHSSTGSLSFDDKQAEKRFAYKLHGYTHFTVSDMKKLCERGGVLSDSMEKYLQESFDKCTVCKQTGRPLHSRKVSFSKVLSSFNDTVQIDFVFVSQLSKLPILHIVDVASGFSAAELMPSRDMSKAMKTFERIWVNMHGPPLSLSADVEFLNKFSKELRYFGIEFNPTPARRHNKLGVVERKNAVLRVLIQRLLLDSSHASSTRGVTVDHVEILSRATYLSNILLGGKLLSSFELARGFTPQIAGLPKTKLSEEIIESHREQVARRALHILRKSHPPAVTGAKDFEKGERVYFFRRGPKFGTWHTAFVRETNEQFLLLSSSPDHRGKPIRCAYEDVRSVPKSTLLQALDEYEFLFPRSEALVPGLEELVEPLDLPEPPPLFENPADTPVQLPDGTPPQSPPSPSAQPDSSGLADVNDVADMFDTETSLWASHPCSISVLSNQKPRRVNEPLRDIGTHAYQLHTSLVASQRGSQSQTSSLNEATEDSCPSKDIGNVPITSPSSLPFSLTTCEQQVLRNMRSVIGYQPATEFQLQFAPRWILDKSISVEKTNYQSEEAYEEVDIRRLPSRRNLISSHHFFQIKKDGDGDNLKLKCRLVPHGNRDRDKDSVRKDSSSAQFIVIRVVLSILVLLGFSFGSIDIKSAYLQGGNIQREIYMRPPQGWTSSPFIVWKLRKYAYGLSESGRIWQLVLEDWLSSQNIFEVHGLPQLFVRRHPDGSIALALAKVVDDLLLAGTASEITAFHTAISARFKVGRFTLDDDLIFNGLHISRDSSGNIKYDMIEYFSGIHPIPLSRSRRKEPLSPCTPVEITSFLELTGSLNWLGHGVLPQASFAASHLQQLVGRLTVAHLVTANKVLAELKSLSPSATMLLPLNLDNPSYLAFSDASQGSQSYGQTGYISGLYLPGGSVFHALDWHSSKQRRVAFSSIGAEILAAATSTDRGSLMAERHQTVYGSPIQLPFVLSVDSNGLYSTITTLHEGHDYRLRPTVARMRDSFESHEISVMQWIPGTKNISDALTKRNLASYLLLNKVMISGALDDSILEKAKRTKFSSQLTN